MRFVSEDDFESVASANADYYRKDKSRSRWMYYRQALEMMSRIEFSSCLELGPFLLPLVRGSDTMDINPKIHPTYLWDGGIVPWPVDRQERYGLFVGLQVLEHLGTNQRAAFGEIRRIAEQAIISLPYNWNLPENPMHHNIGDETILDWTHGLTPIERRIVAPDGEVDPVSPKPFLRILLHFNFESTEN